jgi:hypothetical protein
MAMQPAGGEGLTPRRDGVRGDMLARVGLSKPEVAS